MLLLATKKEGTARCSLTPCLKPRACSCQQQAGTASQILTYKLFKIQSMLLLGVSRKSQPYPDLQPVPNPEHALFSSKQEGAARSWLTFCWKPRAFSCQQQARRASQILTYILFIKTLRMLMSTTSKKGQPNPNLHPVQNPEHPCVSNKQEGQPDPDLHPVQNPDHSLVSNK